MLRISALATVAVLSLAPAADAAAIFAFEEVGNDVIGTLSGSIDLTGLVAGPGSFGGAYMYPSAGALSLAPTTPRPNAQVHAVTGPTGYGPRDSILYPTSYSAGTPIALAFEATLFFLSDDYQSGSPLSGEMFFADSSFALMGVTPGDHVWTFGNQDTFTLRFGPHTTVIPLPATLPLLLGGLGLLGLAGRRRLAAG